MTDLPFDPRMTGPVDLAVSAWRRVKAFARRNERELIVSTVVIIGIQAVVWAEWEMWFLKLPQLPSWILVAIGAFVFFAPFAIPIGWFGERWLAEEETVLVSVQSAVTGDQHLKHLTPTAFDEMTILDSRGEERSRDYLEVVRVNGRRAYEVQDYDPDANVALASSMAGRSNSEIRRDREEIGAIKTDLVREADKAVEFMVRASGILRKQGEQVANEIVRIAEDVELPQGSQLHDSLIEARQEADPTDDLLGGGYEDDEDEKDPETVEEAEDVGLDTIFKRAAEGMDSGDEAVADGGVER